MKLLKVLIALVVLSIGISGAAPTDLVATNTLTSAAGTITYSEVYTGTPTVHTAPIANLVVTDSVLSAFLTGATISAGTGMGTGADTITTSLVATSKGGDAASTGLTVSALPTSTVKATVQNYNMYGYVTNNLAYAGQYADQIKGNTIVMGSASNNKETDTVLGPVYPHAGSSAEISATPADVDDIATLNSAYQFAQAGGSKDATAFPMGIWAMSVNDKGHSLVDTQSALDMGLSEFTGSHFITSLTRGATTNAQIGYTGLTIAPNFQSMGYADKNVVYSNEDTAMSGDRAPKYDTTSTNNLGLNPHFSEKTDLQKADITHSELFAYSIIDSANPNGNSFATFF